MIKSEDGNLQYLVGKVVSSNATSPYTFTLSLQQNHHFNITTIAYNSHGNASFSTSLSKVLQYFMYHAYSIQSLYHTHMYMYLGTHGVIDMQINWTEIICIYNAGSYAIGCLVNLTDLVNGMTYCIVACRFSNVSTSPLCQPSKNDLSAGWYMLKVYDILSDGNLAPLPAIIEDIFIELPTTKPSFYCK